MKFEHVLSCTAQLIHSFTIHGSLQVFDGHGGKHAADFACSNLLRIILEDDDFPREIEKVIASAFLQTDTSFAEACSLDSALASGTTALAALVIGRSGFLNPCVIV